MDTLFIWIMLLPVLLIAGTLIVLILGFFGKGKYSENLKAYYKAVYEFWKKLIDFV